MWCRKRRTKSGLSVKTARHPTSYAGSDQSDISPITALALFVTCVLRHSATIGPDFLCG